MSFEIADRMLSEAIYRGDFTRQINFRFYVVEQLRIAISLESDYASCNWMVLILDSSSFVLFIYHALNFFLTTINL